MATAKKLPSGAWRVLVYVGTDGNGKRKYESFTAQTKAEAELLAHQRQVERERGVEIDRAPAEMTVGDAIDRYIEDRSAVLAPKTIREYKTMRRNYFPEIMDLKIRQLSNNKLQGEINREAKRLSPKTLRNFLALLQPSINAVCDDKKFKYNLPMPQKREIDIPSDEEFFRILDEAKGKSVYLPIIISATCGLRRGEIAALNLNIDIDYENNKITVNKDMTENDKGEWVIGTPKTTASYRTVEAPEWVVEELRKARDEGKAMPKPGAITDGFGRIREKLGLDVTFHGLRHYYCSTLLKLGVPDLYAIRRTGHSTTNMLKNVYQHVMSDRDKEVAESINQHFAGFMQHEMQHDSFNNREKTRKIYRYRRKREI